MPKTKINIGLGSYKNIDEVSTRDGISPDVVNCYLDQLGNSIKRIGYEEWYDFDLGLCAGIDGLWYSDRLDLLFVTLLGRTYKINQSIIVTDITGSTLMQTDQKVSFQDDGQRILMANGGQIQYYAGSGTCTIISSSPSVTTLGFIDQYAIACDTNYVYYSNQGDSLTWQPLINYFEAESRNDDIVTIDTGYREVTIFGEETIDVYYDDGSSPFTRLDGGFVEDGLGAKDSVCKIDDTFMYLSKDKRVKKLANRVPVIASTPWDAQIQEFDTVDDAFADVVKIAGKDFYILTFPSENVTIVYDVAVNEWYQWGYWNQTINDIESFRMKYHVHIPKWNKHIIGDSTDSRIHNIATSIYSDDGDQIKFIRRTGHNSHETYSNKLCKWLAFKTKSGLGDGTTEPMMAIRWKDDGGDWNHEQWISLGKIGETIFIRELWKLGMYRTRQYEFIQTESVPFILHNPIETDIEALE